jgi:hypothetical protein
MDEDWNLEGMENRAGTSGSLQRRLDRLNGEGLEVSPDAMPLDFMLAIMRDERQPMSRRERAARDAAQYCHPKLAVAAVIHPDGDLAERLERAIQRANGHAPQVKTIEHQPEAQVVREEHPREELQPGRTSVDGRGHFIPRRRI